jgi:hypothetical protein
MTKLGTCDCQGQDESCAVCGGTGVPLRKTPRRKTIARCLAPYPDSSARVGRCYLPAGHDGKHSAPTAVGAAQGFRAVEWE